MIYIIVIALVLSALVGVVLYVHDIHLKILQSEVTRLGGLTNYHGLRVQEQRTQLRRIEEDLAKLQAAAKAEPATRRKKKS